MGNQDKKTWPMWLGAVVIAGAVAFSGGYYLSKQSEPGLQPATEQPGQNNLAPNLAPVPEPTPSPTPTPSPAPAPGGSSEPGEQAPSGDVISFSAYTGSGSMPLVDRGLENGAFQIKSIDWSSTSNTLYINANMRAFEGVGYFRVKDENGALLEPESALHATEGAPSYSPVKAEIPLVPEYRGKVMVVEFYVKSANDGSRINMLKMKIKPQ
jgi:hypothetical protein